MEGTMNTPDIFQRISDFIRNSATIKIICIGVVVLVLLIPVFMIRDLTEERSQRRDSVVEEISQKWGASQTITGPWLTIPYKFSYKDEKNVERSSIRYFYVLPQNLSISGTVEPHVRYRSLYEAILYNARLTMTGNFVLPALADAEMDSGSILWDKATLSLGITDMKGIQDNITVTFNDKPCQAGPGLKTADIADSGVQCGVPVSAESTGLTFSLPLNLDGSEGLHFVPVGETTHVALSSPWPSPSFDGSYLPASRDISSKGFSADWKVLHLNRNYPQFWQGNQYNVEGSSFGLRLLITADIYQKAIRILKYAPLFMVFTFSAFFFSEVISKRRVHPIQYLLVGFAVALFYVLLLAVAEYINFDYAYILSALAIAFAITAYSQAILRNTRFTVTVCGVLILLYAYLYVVLQLEDYALITGSVGLFGVLATVMYITRNIDWYGADKRESH
jgi:inner membrane protein